MQIFMKILRMVSAIWLVVAIVVLGAALIWPDMYLVLDVSRQSFLTVILVLIFGSIIACYVVIPVGLDVIVFLIAFMSFKKLSNCFRKHPSETGRPTDNA